MTPLKIQHIAIPADLIFGDMYPAATLERDGVEMTVAMQHYGSIVKFVEALDELHSRALRTEHSGDSLLLLTGTHDGFSVAGMTVADDGWTPTVPNSQQRKAG